jgi:hypothetical protein
MGKPHIATTLASVIASNSEVKGPIVTIAQFEDRHPATRNRMRGWLLRADLGLPEFDLLRAAVFRVGRSVLLDENGVLIWLKSRSNQPPDKPRNPHGRYGKRNEIKRSRLRRFR